MDPQIQNNQATSTTTNEITVGDVATPPPQIMGATIAPAQDNTVKIFIGVLLFILALFGLGFFLFFKFKMQNDTPPPGSNVERASRKVDMPQTVTEATTTTTVATVGDTNETDDNAFLLVKKIRNLIELDSNNGLFSQNLFDIGLGKTWDEKIARENLSRNKEALSLFSDASKKKIYDDPQYAIITKLTVKDIKPVLNLIKNISVISNVDFETALHDNDVQRAKQIFLERLSFTNLLLMAHVDQISSIQASALKNQALLQLLEHLTKNQTLTATSSLDYEKIINSSAVSTSTYSEFLRVENDKFKAMGEIATDNILQKSGNSDADAEEKIRQANDVSYNDYLMVSQTYKEEIEKPCSVMSDTPVRNKLASIQIKTGLNAAIETLFNGTIPPFFEPMLSYMNRRCNDELASSVAKDLVAIKAYKDTNGKLPPSLSELIPTYLTTLPFDPYSGTSLKYSKEKSYIYSVGVDKKDDGGTADATLDWQKMNDPTFLLIK